MTTAAHDSSSPLLGKRRIDAILENKENIAIKRQGRVAALLDEFDIEVEARCEALKAHAAELATSFRNQLSIELIKIPKAIREMPMKEFVEKYGGDLNVYIEEGIKKRAQSIEQIPQPPQTPNKDVSGTPNQANGSEKRSKKQIQQNGKSKIMLHSENGKVIDLNSLIERHLAKKTGKKDEGVMKLSTTVQNQIETLLMYLQEGAS